MSTDKHTISVESIRASATGDTTFDEQLRFLLAEIAKRDAEIAELRNRVSVVRPVDVSPISFE